MAITREEAFRFGFLLRCAEEGCTPTEVERRVKLARDSRTAYAEQREKVATNPIQETVDTAKSVGNPFASLAKLFFMAPVQLSALGIAGSGVLGAGAGYGLARMQDSSIDPEEVKRQELANAYRVQGRALLRNTMRSNPAVQSMR